MDLKITSIADLGDPKKERVVMKAAAPIDVGLYALFRTLLRNGQNPTSYISNIFWLPDQQVQPGDLVIVYTKDGSSSSKKLESGKTAYFFYMGEGNSLWLDKDYAPMLVSFADWDTFIPKR